MKISSIKLHFCTALLVTLYASDSEASFIVGQGTKTLNDTSTNGIHISNGGGTPDTNITLSGNNPVFIGSAVPNSSSVTAGNNTINIGVVNRVNGDSSAAIGLRTTATESGTLIIGGYTSQTSGQNSVLINRGRNTAALSLSSGNATVSIGQGSTSANHAVAFGGAGTLAGGVGGVALGGAGSNASGTGSIALGGTALQNYSISIGNGSVTSGENGVSLGSTARAGTSSFAAGRNAVADGTSAVVLGTGSQASNAGDVALGARAVTGTTVATSGITIAGQAYQFAGSAPESQVSFGNAAEQKQLQNVAAGQISRGSTDAVNGSQLFATNTAIQLTDGARGNVNDNTTGLIRSFRSALLGQAPSDNDAVLPEFIVQSAQGNSQTETSVAGAVSVMEQQGVAYFHANASDSPAVVTGNGSVAAGGGAVSGGDSSVALGQYSFDEGRRDVVSVGAPGMERQIIYVDNGVQDTDLANIRQLEEVQNSVSNANAVSDGQLQTLESRLQATHQRLQRGIAVTSAMASIPKTDGYSDKGIGIGLSTFMGTQAVAVGFQSHLYKKLKFSLTTGISAGNSAVGGGLFYEW